VTAISQELVSLRKTRQAARVRCDSTHSTTLGVLLLTQESHTHRREHATCTQALANTPLLKKTTGLRRSRVLPQLLLRKKVKVEPFSKFQACTQQSGFARKGCSAPWSLFRSSSVAPSFPASQQTPAGYAAEEERKG